MTGRTSPPDERAFGDRTLAVLRHLLARAGFDDATVQPDGVEFGDLEARARYDVLSEGVVEWAFSRGVVTRTGTVFDAPEDAARYIALQAVRELRVADGLSTEGWVRRTVDDVPAATSAIVEAATVTITRTSDDPPVRSRFSVSRSRDAAAFATVANVELESIVWCGLQADVIRAFELASGLRAASADDAPHARALGRLTGNRASAPASVDGIRRAPQTLFECGDHEVSVRIDRGSTGFDVVGRSRGAESVIATCSHVDDAERLIAVLRRSTDITIPVDARLAGPHPPVGVTAESDEVTAAFAWRSLADGGRRWVRWVASSAGRWCGSPDLVRLTWLRDVPVNALVAMLAEPGRAQVQLTEGIGVTLTTDALVQAFTRGRSGFRDDVQSSIVCAELRRLVVSSLLPAACWEAVRNAIYGTHMDSWSSGLPVDERYERLWPLFEGSPPTLADGDSASVDLEVAVAATEYGVTVVSGEPRVTRRLPLREESVVEVWSGSSWLARPGTAFGRPLDRPAVVRLAGWPRPDAFG